MIVKISWSFVTEGLLAVIESHLKKSLKYDKWLDIKKELKRCGQIADFYVDSVDAPVSEEPSVKEVTRAILTLKNAVYHAEDELEERYPEETNPMPFKMLERIERRQEDAKQSVKSLNKYLLFTKKIENSLN